MRIIRRQVSVELVGLWLLELTISFWLACLLLGTGFADAPQPSIANHAMVLALTGTLTGFAIGLYRADVFRRIRSMLVSTALGSLVMFPAVWVASLVLGVSTDRLLGRDDLWPVKIVLIWVVAVFAVRLLFLAAVRANVFVRRVGVLGPVGSISRTADIIRTTQRGFIEIEDARGPGGALPAAAALRGAGIRDLIAVHGAPSTLAPALRAGYEAAGITIETEAQFWERHLKRVDVGNLDAAWFDTVQDSAASRLQSFVNRAGDIAASLLLLLFTLPLMVLAAVLIRLDSPGPALYRQVRAGAGGHPFTVLKFRSMRVDAEARGPVWAKQRDPRVTRIGAFMRRTRIDELPQLLNVLRGQMSFIGPRPERPHFVEQLAAVIPFYRERTRVKPGLTGWAQVNFPYGASVEDARSKLSYDLYYVKYRSPLLDLAIMFATVRVILFQEGSR